MKTASSPSVRVNPSIRAEFIARGLRSRDEAQRTGDYVDAEVVIEQLQRILNAARTRVPPTKK